MRAVKLFILSLAFSSAAGAATLQTLYTPSTKDAVRQVPAGTPKPAPMPAPAETSHYAANTLSEKIHG